MSKKSYREETLIERLEKENRELKSQVRSLSKRLKKLTRGYYKFLDEESQDEKEIIIEKAVEQVNKVCFECGGNYKLLVIVNRRFRKCQDCGKTGKVTIINARKQSKK